jgi:hypothetical protein
MFLNPVCIISHLITLVKLTMQLKLLERPQEHIDDKTMRGFISELSDGNSPDDLAARFRQAVPQLEHLRHKMPGLEELLKVHQESIRVTSVVSIIPTCRYKLEPEAGVLALRDIKTGNIPHHVARSTP